MQSEVVCAGCGASWAGQDSSGHRASLDGRKSVQCAAAGAALSAVQVHALEVCSKHIAAIICPFGVLPRCCLELAASPESTLQRGLPFWSSTGGCHPHAPPAVAA